MEAVRVSPANAEDVAAALDAQANAVLEQVLTLSVHAERLHALAEEVRSVGLRAGGRVVARPPQGDEKALEVRVREVLMGCELSTEYHLAESVGVSVKTLRPLLDELAAAGSVAVMRAHGERICTWLYPDGRGDAPDNAPRSEGRVLADVRRDANMIDVDRGKPVRLVTTNRDRRARSTPGVRHKMKLKDAAYERQEAAKAARTEAQRRKAKGQ